jgi:hypothetical protein
MGDGNKGNAMTRKNTGGKKIKVELLKLNRETVADLTDAEADAAEGGHATTIILPAVTCEKSHCLPSCWCPPPGATIPGCK